MRTERALEFIVDASRRLARAYAKLTEALMMEGVPEELARQEARSMVVELAFLAQVADEEDGEPWHP